MNLRQKYLLFFVIISHLLVSITLATPLDFKIFQIIGKDELKLTELPGKMN